jgi:hypothetical protein
METMRNIYELEQDLRNDNNHTKMVKTYLYLKLIAHIPLDIDMYKEKLYCAYTDNLRGISANNMNI